MLKIDVKSMICFIIFPEKLVFSLKWDDLWEILIPI